MEVSAVPFCLLLMVLGGQAQRDKQLYCAVCRSVVDEINWQISQVDPKKTLKTGSFRVDPKGNQNIKTVPFARSETHLTEVIEEICQSMSKYAQNTDDNGKTNVVRTYSRSDKPLKLKNFNINREKSKQLQFYCDSLIEDHEEEMMGLFKRESQPNIDRIICGDISAACTEAQLNEPMPVAEQEEDEDEDMEDEDEEEDMEEDMGEDYKDEL